MEQILTLFTNSLWLGAIIIFIARVINMAISTIRMLFTIRNKKLLTWVLGFIESIIFVYIIGTVISNLNNFLNIIAYAAGFASGGVVGMLIEERLAIGHIQMTVISPMRGTILSEELRSNGFAVTEISGRGKQGTVSVLLCDVLRKDINNLETVVLETDPEAFITAEDVRPVRHGFWRA